MHLCVLHMMLMFPERSYPQCLCHNHSCRSRSKRSLYVPVRGILCLTPHHVFSIHWVCAPVDEVQAVVNCVMATALAFQAVVSFPHVAQHACIPANMLASIMGRTVSLSGFCLTGTRKGALVPRQMPPKTHCPSMQRPQMYFVLQNLESARK